MELTTFIDVEYKDVFGWNPKTAKEDNSKRWFNQKMMDTRNEIYPGVWQNSEAFISAKVRITRDLEDAFAGELNDFELSSVLQGLVSWTWLQDKKPLSPEDNSNFRAALELKEPDDLYLEIYRYVLNQSMRLGEFKGLRVNGKSQSGAPFFVKDRDYRIERAILAMDNLDDIHRLIIQGEFSDLVRDYHILPILTDGQRIQADRVRIDDNGMLSIKQRKYPTLESLRYPEDPTLAHSIHTLKNAPYYVEGYPIFPGRVRLMLAGSSPYNHILGAFHNWAYAGYEKYFKTAEYHGPEPLYEEFKQMEERYREIFDHEIDRYTFSLDKENFDLTMAPILNNLDVEVYSEYWAQEIIDLYIIGFGAPALVRSFNKGEHQPILSRELCSGKKFLEHYKRNGLKNALRSGFAFVSKKGKDIGQTDICSHFMRFIKENYKLVEKELAFLQLTFDDLANVDGRAKIMDAFFKNEIPGLIVKSFGDDTLVHTVIPNFGRSFSNYISEPNSFKVHNDSIENVPTFLGYRYNNEGKWFKDAAKFIETLLGQERSFKSKTNFELGLYSRKLEYVLASNPYVAEILRIVSKHLLDLGYDLERAIEKGSIHSLQTVPDLEFINKPEVIFYKYKPEEISPELLDSEFSAITAEECEDILGCYILH